ncbi:PAS domain-containing sensor histidine kinase [Reichenbachiella carrageenanivorans]|uniref:histidine kinase n=1 Tax=Reichenbachiella carrageenanivorans TaxID=2979869 RepID=A0ABY6D0E3_9BACT|nr:PAS domain-containing sensor histidine kinase [Reichenbachiella carrageenanivorans]UXX79631.1 PAS domain-containing sensor histidine kinase [Reichenbachiella carrageenanivorans]
MKQKDLIAQLEHTNDRLWSYDQNLICTYVNHNMSQDYLLAFGHSLEIGMHVLYNVPEPVFSTWEKRYRKALAGKKYSLIDHFHIKGIAEYVEITFSPIIENNEVRSVACCSKDITQIKRSEIKLKQSEANLNAQIENTTDSIWSVNDRYELVTMNAAFKKGFDRVFSSDLQLGDVLINYLPEPHKLSWKERYDRTLAGEKFEIVETFNFEETPVYTEISYNPVRVEGQIVGVACFTRDITALKTSELALKKALEARDKFFSIIAHDLRGPISNINQLARLLKKQKGDIQDQSKALHLLSDSSASVYRLLDNLLNWALAQRGDILLDIEQQDLKYLVEASLEPYLINAELKKLYVKVKIEEDVMVLVDKRTVTSIMANLFNNAIKFTKEGGEICFRASRQGDQVIIQVKDSGVGMSQQQIETIMNSDVVTSTSGTRKEKGTGFGLVLTKEFIKLNGGELKITSEEGKGSTFEFTFPSC